MGNLSAAAAAAATAACRVHQSDEWKMDRIPEIMDGKNVADFVDEDIDKKLALLEQEEDQLQVTDKEGKG